MTLAKRVNVIKAVRELTGLGLKEAKDLATRHPGLILEATPNGAADKSRTGSDSSVSLHTWTAKSLGLPEELPDIKIACIELLDQNVPAPKMILINGRPVELINSVEFSNEPPIMLYTN